MQVKEVRRCEENSYSFDSFLSKIPFTFKENQMSLYADVFTVWARGDSEIRSCEGQCHGGMENHALQPVFERRV